MILAVWATFLPTVAAAEPGKEPDIKGKYAAIMDRDSGRILYEKEGNTRAYPASMTKLMTALLAVENLSMDQQITASREAVDIEADGSALGIIEGEVFTAEQLIYALLVQSANDAANVLAEAVSGTVSAFVERMNQRALELGMGGTHFMNPHGYHDANHYTTAIDMAKLLDVCLEQEILREALSTASYMLPPTNLWNQERHMVNTNSMITAQRESGYVYEPVKGGKTGSTSDAGHCLAAFGERDNKHLITVVMDSVIEGLINHSFYDTKQLMEYGFNNFQLKTVVSVNEILESVPVRWGAGNGQASLFAEDALTVLLGVDENPEDLEKNVILVQNLTAPIEKGQILGTIEYAKDGQYLGKVNLVVSEKIKRDSFKMIFGSIWSFLTKPVVIGVFVAIVLFLILRVIRVRNKRRRMRMKKRRYYGDRRPIR